MNGFYLTRARNGVLFTWANGKYGRFVDIEKNNSYRFIEYCGALDPPIPVVASDKYLSLPVIACGLVSYIVKRCGALTPIAIEEFFRIDSFFEDKTSFILPHEDVFISRYVNQSINLFSFIPKNECDWIKGLIAYYYEYLHSKIAHKEFLSLLIPDHVNGEYADELKNIFLNGVVSDRRINWKTTHREMRNLLKPFLDDGSIPNESSWEDFVVDNFLKNHKKISKKSVFNEKTRPNWG